MAWNVFAVPAMSAEVERVFSGYNLFQMNNVIDINRTKLLTSDTRNRLSPDIIEGSELDSMEESWVIQN